MCPSLICHLFCFFVFLISSDNELLFSPPNLSSFPALLLLVLSAGFSSLFFTFGLCVYLHPTNHGHLFDLLCWPRFCIDFSLSFNLWHSAIGFWWFYFFFSLFHPHFPLSLSLSLTHGRVLLSTFVNQFSRYFKGCQSTLSIQVHLQIWLCLL